MPVSPVVEDMEGRISLAHLLFLRIVISCAAACTLSAYLASSLAFCCFANDAAMALQGKKFAQSLAAAL